MSDLVLMLMRLAGAFYFATAFLVVRAAAQAGLMDAVLGALSGAPDRREAGAQELRRWWLTLGAVLTGLGGLSAAGGWAAAAPLFLASALGQWTWLLVVAPRLVDPFDAPDPAGRRSTRNAAIGHTALTLVVLLSAPQLGVWSKLPILSQAAVGVGWVALTAYALRALWRGRLGHWTPAHSEDED